MTNKWEAAGEVGGGAGTAHPLLVQWINTHKSNTQFSLHVVNFLYLYRNDFVKVTDDWEQDDLLNNEK